MFFFLVYFKINITDVRIDSFNIILDHSLVSYLFTLFCILVLMNGSNFIDGVNLLSIGYFLLVLISIILISDNYNLSSNLVLVKNLLIILTFLFLMNLFNQIFLGDSGIYLLSFIIGIILIKFHNDNELVSPYYIISLLWYPCFENLFSIIRKKKFNLSPLNADNKHLHHLLFYFLNSNYKFSKLFSNNMSSTLINLVNFIFFIIGANYVNNSLVQIFLIFTLILIYISTYLVLFKFRYKKIY